ncbi:MAG: hypothetical protein JWL63_789 [Rhodocyclales bacterium]|nr:hypothetical protein [Rhodocyclales bacterium]
MFRIYLGFTVLATMLMLPLGNAIARFAVYSAPEARDSFLVIKMSVALAIGMAIAFAFIRISHLSERVPQRTPGGGFMLLGSILYLAIPALLILLVEYGFPREVVDFAVTSALHTFIGLVLLVVGCVRVLLSARSL